MKLPWAEIVVIGLVVAAGAGVFALAHKDEDLIAESKERGAAIVSALEQYRASAGEYPNALADLVPEHRDDIAAPTWGLRRWHYRGYAPDSVRAADPAAPRTLFQLSVAADESGYPVLYYDIAARRWVLNN
jgi:type II secretory pathway pseudopilin PulG